MAGVVTIPWYATVLRGDKFADAVAEMSPSVAALRRDPLRRPPLRDDKYKIDQMLWFESKDDWYRFWESPELIEFRARNMGKYQVPVDLRLVRGDHDGRAGSAGRSSTRTGRQASPTCRCAPTASSRRSLPTAANRPLPRRRPH